MPHQRFNGLKIHTQYMNEMTSQNSIFLCSHSLDSGEKGISVAWRIFCVNRNENWENKEEQIVFYDFKVPLARFINKWIYDRVHDFVRSNAHALNL